MLITVSTSLPMAINEAWDLLQRKSTFLYITRGLMGYTDHDQWPELLFQPDVIIHTGLKVLHVLPSTPHTFQITKVDKATFTIETHEHGEVIQTWRHVMHLEPIDNATCRYTDQIEFKAGIFTPLVGGLATIFYRYRQWRWHKWSQIKPMNFTN